LTGTPPRRIALVCLGNICRSPTAEVVMNSLLAQAGLDAAAESCGTAGWHVGEPMDPRSAAVLASAGYDPSRHRARQFGPDWFDCDLILVMDRQNLADVREVLPAQRHDRVRLFLRPDGRWRRRGARRTGPLVRRRRRVRRRPGHHRADLGRAGRPAQVWSVRVRGFTMSHGPDANARGKS
jgi:protein-tyrosine-phosphatase